MKIVSPYDSFIVKVHHTCTPLEDCVLFKSEPDFPPFTIEMDFWNPIDCAVTTKTYFRDNHLTNLDMEYFEFVQKGLLFYTPLIFGSIYAKLDPSTYLKPINSDHFSQKALLKVPFRDNSFASEMGQDVNILGEFVTFQKSVKKIVTNKSTLRDRLVYYIRSKVKMMEKVVYINGYFVNTSSDKLFCLDLNREWDNIKERNADPDFRRWLNTPCKATIFNGWFSYIYWRLLQEIEKGNPFPLCQHCGNVLYVQSGGHKDRQYCKKIENPICFRFRASDKKRRQRGKKIR